MNKLESVIEETIQIIKSLKLLNLPDQIDIEYETRKPEKGYIVRASTCILENIIYVNPERCTVDNIIPTICHELVHIEQGHTGILSYPDDCNDYQWGDKRYPLPKTHKQYIDFPWEKDANLRGPKLAKAVKQVMKVRDGYVSSTR